MCKLFLHFYRIFHIFCKLSCFSILLLPFMLISIIHYLVAVTSKQQSVSNVEKAYSAVNWFWFVFSIPYICIKP